MENKPKKSKIKKVLLTIGIIIGSIILIVGAYLAYVFIYYYRVEDNLQLDVNNTAEVNGQQLPVGKELTVISYNIGFGAYSDDFTFFMDGGKESIARSKDAVYENLNGAMDAIKPYAADLVLIQEIDKDGTRSWHVDETETVSSDLSSVRPYCNVYAQNWDNAYFLYPIYKPHGANKSGIMIFSAYEISSAIRRSLPIDESVAKIVDLDRCYIKSRIPVSDGNDLVLYNAHLSAYTTDPTVAANQLSLIINDMQEEYDRGNYCIAGGDLNSDLLGDSPSVFHVEGLEKNWASPVRTDLFTDDITLVVPYDENNPHASARNCDKPYQKGNFVVTVDGFIKSTNVNVIKSDVIETEYKYSDHNPVYLKFTLSE